MISTCIYALTAKEIEGLFFSIRDEQHEHKLGKVHDLFLVFRLNLRGMQKESEQSTQ